MAADHVQPQRPGSRHARARTTGPLAHGVAVTILNARRASVEDGGIHVGFRARRVRAEHQRRNMKSSTDLIPTVCHTEHSLTRCSCCRSSLSSWARVDALATEQPVIGTLRAKVPNTLPSCGETWKQLVTKREAGAPGRFLTDDRRLARDVIGDVSSPSRGVDVVGATPAGSRADGTVLPV